MMNFRFRKQERIVRKKTIDKVFQEGKSFYSYSLRVNFLANEQSPGTTPLKLLISVPKRIHRTAVARNRIKRLIREAYRINKNSLLNIHTQSIKQINVAFIYTNKNIISFEAINKEIQWIIRQLEKKIN